jgi:hypothetical protein
VVSKLQAELESRKGPAGQRAGRQGRPGDRPVVYSDGGAAPAAGKSLQDTQRLMMREVAHSIISNSMCHFHSCSQTMGFRAWTRISEEMDGTLQISNFPLRGLHKNSCNFTTTQSL